MKKAKFRKIEITMERGNSYGHYFISAFYKNKRVTASTTDSEAWDWLDDDSNKEKHANAKRHCYNKIVQTCNEF